MKLNWNFQRGRAGESNQTMWMISEPTLYFKHTLLALNSCRMIVIYASHALILGILSQPTTKLFINGQFVESSTDKWIDIHNPVSRVQYTNRYSLIVYNPTLT